MLSIQPAMFHDVLFFVMTVFFLISYIGFWVNRKKPETRFMTGISFFILTVAWGMLFTEKVVIKQSVDINMLFNLAFSFALSIVCFADASHR